MDDALHEARQEQEAAADAGFDWADVEGPIAKLREEIEELDEAVSAGNAAAAGDELGDILFSAVNVSRFLAVDASSVLRRSTRRFQTRFGRLREEVQRSGKRMRECTLQELDAVWDRLKDDESTSGGAHVG